jgi:hypothetical protein
MKKLLLSGLALTVCLSAIAQNGNREIQSKLDQAITSKAVPMVKPSDAPIIPFRAINTTVHQSRSSMVEVPIGGTYYDLQSNYGTMGNRFKLWDDNTMSAVWTKGDDFGASYPDRGTGYNYYDGSTWGAIATSRIETFRTGWPNVSGTSGSGEIIVNHAPTSMVSRATKGSGAWTETTPLAGLAVTWPRMVVGGANGNSVHVIGNENANNFYMTYSRSLDGGATWADENILLPDFLTHHFEGSVDAYDIDSRGDVVAIVMGGWNESLSLWKSTDNGATWTHTIINEFPLAPWDYNTTNSDVDGDGIGDTIVTVDGGISAVIDNNNIVHVAVGSMRILSDVPGPPSYFPGTDGLLYWNENMPAGDITNNYIAGIQDIDGDGMITFQADDPAIYQACMTGMPSLGVDAGNNIHLVYSSIIENTTNGGVVGCVFSFRNNYYMYSTDMGMNWSTPARVEESDFDEMVWPSLTKRVDATCVHLIYHKDGNPGNTFQPQGNVCHPASPYDIMYVCLNNPVGINESSNDISAAVYPNPSSSVLNVDYTITKSQSVSIELVDVLGKVAYSTTQMATSGVNNLRINVKDLASGVYSVNIQADGKVSAHKVVIR